MKKIVLASTGLLLSLALVGCGSKESTKPKPAYRITSGVHGSTAVLDSDGYIDIKGITPKKYKKVTVEYDGTTVDTLKVKNGKFSYYTNGSGGPLKLKLVASAGDSSNDTKTITIKVPKSKETSDSKDMENSSENESSATETTFGTAQDMGTEDGSLSATITVLSAKKITDPNEGLTADLIANYPDLKQFAIVSYKVQANSAIPDGTFDGSELTFLDAGKTAGTVSSNRDPGSDGDLATGESRVYRIGVGFYSTDPTMYVRIGGVTWKGTIAQ